MASPLGCRCGWRLGTAAAAVPSGDRTVGARPGVRGKVFRSDVR
ncbi:hypothetical protein STXM2123_3426 [Streptomyces sp. F-3]|nr:hypothetical protein STXM2123_3426 [Streptomyces sp. F-3]